MKLTIPNQLTIIRIILTPVFLYFIIQPDQSLILLASLIFMFAALTDWYDGYIARRLNLTSRWGQFMDPFADKILVSTALGAFAYLNYIYWWMVIVIVFRDFLITFLRSYALYRGKAIITSNFAKWKTFFQMVFIIALMIYINFPQLPDIHLNQTVNPFLLWTTLSLSFVVLLTAISGIHYLIVNRSHTIELWRRFSRSVFYKE
ncbi:MAG: CDP-diacylglycerol--glycerol-3-phosphate 3-phosphatidyltransferase [Calditrichaceae bacterium]